ncbi:lactonase family protein [Lacticaseibacillus sharpeae]|uniref:3-carboxymuconate cyclase n=1 Tax=Lacticaseibacillus sharpeae JCM 1186 = DSM 20505 TaxID=1291052 RepID=A0A0R1ZUR8_9LACO|nr:lactonase family protein [Lacticaseibacillus sharpeae]KRM55526.1 3-carboxymuconate cyclase [Lacticaseibacillus sharpeae JCM 1186 = DSM 20505]
MAEEKVILGGYTKKGGAGIYQAVLDTVTGSVSTPLPYVTGINGPTYLALSKANRLYTVAGGDGVGGVAAVDLNGEQPKILGSVLQPGTSPAHVSVDEDRRLVYAANYHEGRLNVYAIQEDGSLVATDEAKHNGNGPLPEQDASHVHFAGLTPDKRIVVVDLGNDTVSTYEVSAAGKLSTPTVFKTAPGFGPRHIVFHPTKPVAYLLGELSSKVQVLDYDATNGTFAVRQTLTTIPTDWTEHNGAAAVRISADARFLYTSNRGHNSIATFAIDRSGELEFVNHVSTFGDFPRDFAIDPSGNYLLAVNQNSDNGTLYRRDPVNGTLTTLAINIPTPETVCVVFA